MSVITGGEDFVEEVNYEKTIQWAKDYGELIRVTSAEMAEAMRLLAEANRR